MEMQVMWLTVVVIINASAIVYILWRILRQCQALFSQSWAHHKWWIAKETPEPQPDRYKMPSVPHDPKRDRELRRQYREKIRLAKEAEK